MNASTRYAVALLAGLVTLGCTGDGTTDKAPTADSGTTSVVDADDDGVAAADDCDDMDASLGAIADDADCDGLVQADDCDDNDASLNDDDVDADGFSSCAGDCDDASEAVNPGAPEIPSNGVDENCDTLDTALILLNEMQYDPASGDPAEPGDGGDANYDGIRDPADDEFVELVNGEDFAVDISGFQLFDNENLKVKTPNHTVADGTVLEAGKALVVFGGGTPGVDARTLLADGKTANPDLGATTNDFGGSVVQVADFGELNLNNGGDILYVQDAAGSIVLVRDIKTFPNYTSGADQSYTRNPDLTGKFDLHTNVAAKVLFSPGTRNDGKDF